MSGFDEVNSRLLMLEPIEPLPVSPGLEPERLNLFCHRDGEHVRVCRGNAILSTG